MNKQIDISIIIISYNTKDLLVQCLHSIVKSIKSTKHYEIIIVDNASTDGSIEKIMEMKKSVVNISLIKNTENLGFSKANNIGVEHAKGKYILFLNSDTKVDDHTIEEMVAFMDYHKDAGAATCYVELPNGSLDDAAHRGYPTPWNAFCHFSGLGKLFPQSTLLNGYHMGWKDLHKIHEIDALAGAFMIVRREAGDEVGWWDEEYFFYGEDLDFCYMLKQNNWKIYFVPHIKVLHYKGVSSGIKKISQDMTSANKERKRMITHARFEAMRIFYRKHYLEKYPSFLTKIVLLGISLKEKITLQSLS